MDINISMIYNFKSTSAINKKTKPIFILNIIPQYKFIFLYGNTSSKIPHLNEILTVFKRFILKTVK